MLSVAQYGTSTSEGNEPGNLGIQQAKFSGLDAKKVASKTDWVIGSICPKGHSFVHSLNEMSWDLFWHLLQASTKEYVTLLHEQRSAMDEFGPR